ncbi:response regulator [Marinobacter sp. M-5]|uniref:response regulator n=1 Tax=Marinobacter sp. M-5 TaxID=3081089 RepID=UPI00293C7402|nr:response regulator [Marinobacter sp. M-5]MDV3504938.1 response regulator [Marinobacter sp. M-5]
MRPITILMADDDPLDRMLTQEAFEESKSINPLYFVENGEELLKYLRRHPPYNAEEHPFPDLILLDLNMPKMDGRDCLVAIKKDPTLKHVPVIVLTTSNREEEVFRSYDLGASSFISKPVDFEKLVSQIRIFNSYWCSIVELPDASEH